MLKTKLIAIFASISIGITVSGCESSDPAPQNAYSVAVNNANSASRTVTSTNVEELGLYVNIPYDVEDIAFRGPGAGKHILAVLKFSHSDAEKAAAEASRIKPPAEASASVEDWYPEELTAMADLSGDDTIKVTVYSPAQFANEPYTNGRLMRVGGTDYFILDIKAN